VAYWTSVQCTENRIAGLRALLRNFFNCVLFVCKYELYYCHMVSTQLLVTKYIISRHIRDVLLDQISTEYLFTTTLPTRVAKCAPCTIKMQPAHLLCNAALLIRSSTDFISETRNKALWNYNHIRTHAQGPKHHTSSLP